MSVSLNLRSTIVVLLIAASGCARLVPSVNYTAAGTADPALDREGDSTMREAIKNGTPGSEKVVVLVDATPEGVRMEGNRPVVQPGYQHQVLGKVSIAARTGGFFFIARFLDYRETWRKALCYWQAPLEWFTLGIWSLVPLSYPCFAGAPYLGKEDALNDTRNAAKSVGADVAILSYEREKNEKVRGVTAWLIRLDPRPKTPDPVGSPRPPPAPAP